jgi:hypothetical protein
VTAWVSPLPDGLRMSVQVYRPGHDVRRLAGVIVERAWRRQGVRVYRWPCGTVAVVLVGSRADAVLLTECVDHLLVTYARHDLLGKPGPGPLLVDVLHDLNWAKATAA